MSRHCTEQQLIDYQFKLASEAEMEAVRVHLETCEACNRKLQSLMRRFASLDLVRDEVSVSEALLNRTVQNAARSRPPRIISLYRLPWLGAVAAAVIAGFAFLLMFPSGRGNRATGPAPLDSRRQEAVPATALSKGEADVAEPSALSGGRDMIEAEAPMPVQAAPALMAPSVASAEEVAEEPPFAPASAIELVVLPRRENVQLTIYNAADLTLVRERRNLTLKRGWNWLQFMWANTLIDPTSLSLEPLEHKDAVEVQQLVFPPRLRERDPKRESSRLGAQLGRWLIRSEVSGQVPFELTYLTSGLTWRAFYMGTLSQDETTMRLEGYVRVANNSGEDYEDAQTRLIVGRVHLLDQIAELAQRRYPYNSPIIVDREGGEAGGRTDEMLLLDSRDVSGPVVSYEWNAPFEGLKPKEVRKEGLSEYFLYTIEGAETIPNEWGKRLLSFEADDIPVKNLYKYDQERWGDQAVRFLSFANDEDHELGQTPIPDGMVRIYGRADEQGHLSYIGGMDVKYIPVGEEVELDLGPARLVEVKPVLMDYRTENHIFDQDGNVSGWDEVRTWRIEVANAGTLPIDVEVTRGFETPYWTLRRADANASYEKHDVTHARFRLSVEPRSQRSFECTVTTYHGVREETLSQRQNAGN